MVERSLAWLIGPEGRCRKLRYRRTLHGDLWLHLRMVGLNLRRLLNLGLTRHTGMWTIAYHRSVPTPPASPPMATPTTPEHTSLSARTANPLSTLNGLTYRRTRGLVGALPGPKPDLFSALLVGAIRCE